MRVFRIEGKKHPLEWRVWIENEIELHSEAGVAGGRMQHTFDIIKSVGKAHTKAFIPAPQNAVLEAARRIRKKVEAGYEEIDPKTNKQLNDAASELSFDVLPKNLCFMKCRKPPDNKAQIAAFNEALSNPIITIKRDGFMHPILIDTAGNVKIYTRRMDDCTEKYPHIVKAITRTKLPKRTIILSELVTERDDGSDDRLAIQAISNSLPERARALQQAGPKAKAIFLYIAFWGGESLADLSFGAGIEFLEQQFGTKDRKPEHCDIMEVFYGSFEEAKKHVIDKNIEGLVIYNANESPGSMLFNFRGKPERPMAFKWKPIFEDDFICVFDPDCESGRWDPKQCGEWGRGRRKGFPKNLALYQYNRKGEMIFISHVGTGLTEATLQEILDRRINGDVGVAEIHYTSRRYISKGEISNSLVEPRFVRWRPDKKRKECVDDNI
jgi:ATP-dependent DNA ligase